MKNQTVIIIGGGTGGIMTAAQLRKARKDLKIVLFEPCEKHVYQPAFTLVAADTFSFNKLTRNEKDLIPNGVKWVKSLVKDIRPEENEVIDEQGNRYGYDYLVLSPGISLDCSLVPGMQEGLEDKGVISVYTDPVKVKDELKNFNGKRAIFTSPTTPIKCGGAPMKVLFMAENIFKRSKKNIDMLYLTPGGVVFGVPGFKERLEGIFKRKNIPYLLKHRITRIDPIQKRVFFEFLNEVTYSEDLIKTYNIQFHDKEVSFEYDLLHLPPPQTAPRLIQDSPFAHKEGENKGWMNVDVKSLQNPDFHNVFGIGDAAALPTAKTGAAIRKQVPVVVSNILSLSNKGVLSDRQYDGYSSCPIITDYGKMLLAEFKYDNIPAPDPLLKKLVNVQKENSMMWILKKLGLPFLYWNFMMKGRM